MHEGHACALYLVLWKILLMGLTIKNLETNYTTKLSGVNVAFIFLWNVAHLSLNKTTSDGDLSKRVCVKSRRNCHGHKMKRVPPPQLTAESVAPHVWRSHSVHLKCNITLDANYNRRTDELSNELAWQREGEREGWHLRCRTPLSQM